MTLWARLAALERWHPPEITGYAVTRPTRDGSMETVVLVIGQTENGHAWHLPLADWGAAYPDGRILKELILADHGDADPEPGSLAAVWFGDGGR